MSNHPRRPARLAKTDGDGVPFREVALSGGEPPVKLYDTSGPYTDDTVADRHRKGPAARRRDWILARGDVEEYQGRARKPEDDGLRRGELLSVPQFTARGASCCAPSRAAMSASFIMPARA